MYMGTGKVVALTGGSGREGIRMKLYSVVLEVSPRRHHYEGDTLTC